MYGDIAMIEKEQALLRALYATCELNKSDKLNAEQTNRLAAVLGLSPEDTGQLAERLQEENLIRLHWGGEVSLTSEGKEHATGKTLSGSTGPVSMGDVREGAQVVVHSPGATVGTGATGVGAIRVEGASGDLAAALQALRLGQEPTNPEARQSKQALEEAIEATIQEAQRPEPDKKTLEQHLKRTTGLLEQLTKITNVTQKLGPALEFVKKGLSTLSSWIPGG